MAMTAALTSVNPTQLVAGRVDTIDVILTVSNSGAGTVNVTQINPFISPTGKTHNAVASNHRTGVPILTGAGSPLFTGTAVASNNAVAAGGSKAYWFSLTIEAPVATSNMQNVLPRKNSTAYNLGDLIAVTTTTDKRTFIYKCTTAGTSTTTQGIVYPGTIGEVVTDGTAAFTQQQPISVLYDVGAICYSDDGSIFTPTVTTVNVQMPQV